ncbi:hypothetical protein CL615_01270 [archaeon]|jgi:hypothetical protein|nr:hypothetical protein [archaeon]MDP6548375.1 hypothetical protein [Candidatus Woesearchaeota archaeon]|tara:strand:- start:15828 stop:17168 length:1341 start_codon:yes stop_codon:yes gene_type:complete
MQSKPLILEKEVKSLIGEDKEPDIVFFTPTLNVENYIRHVLECGYEGLEKVIKDDNNDVKTAMIIPIDSGSTDTTRDVINKFIGETNGNRRGIETRLIDYTQLSGYKERFEEGFRGKGIAWELMFYLVANHLKSKINYSLDSDLISIDKLWVPNAYDKSNQEKSNLLLYTYSRHKYDGSITNILKSLLKQTIRKKHVPNQIIGGDIVFDYRVAEHMSKSDIWGSDVGKDASQYGTDIFVTQTSIFEGMNIAEIFSGKKEHGSTSKYGEDEKFLPRMARQVFNVSFYLTGKYKDKWIGVLPLSENDHDGQYPIIDNVEVKKVKVDREKLRDSFLPYLDNGHGEFLNQHLSEGTYKHIVDAHNDSLYLSHDARADLWTEIAALYHTLKEDKRKELLDVAAYSVYGMSHYSHVRDVRYLDLKRAEKKVINFGQKFVERQPYFKKLMLKK